MKYKAIFSNFQVLTRTSDRTYTHAYLWIAQQEGRSAPTVQKGFAKSEELARKALGTAIGYEKSHGYVRIFAEVQPVQVTK